MPFDPEMHSLSRSGDTFKFLYSLDGSDVAMDRGDLERVSKGSGGLVSFPLFDRNNI